VDKKGRYYPSPVVLFECQSHHVTCPNKGEPTKHKEKRLLKEEKEKRGGFRLGEYRLANTSRANQFCSCERLAGKKGETAMLRKTRERKKRTRPAYSSTESGVGEAGRSGLRRSSSTELGSQ